MAEKSTSELLQEQDPKLYDEINKYIDELKGEAQGDYEFVVKFLKQQFEQALGTDDQARADFFKNVANQLEERIGRIPYDYDVMTGREKEDLQRFLQEKDMEDTRQRELEKEFEAQQELTQEKEQKQIREQASERGMLDSGIEKRQQQEAVEKRQVNQINPQQTTFIYQQALRDLQRQQAKLQSGRNLEDLTTNARRAGQDTDYDYSYGTEKADMSLSRRLAEIERDKKSQYRSGLALQTEDTMGSF